MKKFHREMGVLFSVLLAALIFQVISHGSFLEAENWGNILSLAAEIGIVAVGTTCLMIAGEYDLSVGSSFALAGMVFSVALEKWHLNGFLGLVLALSLAAGVGLVNGCVTVLGRIPSFITTLGTLMILRGAVLGATAGWPVSRTDDPSLLMNLLAGSFGETWRISSLWWILFSLLLHVILYWTVLGNWFFAVGGNADASRAIGVPVKKVKVTAFILSSTLAGVAGIIQFSRMSSFSPTYGEGLELEAITAAVIGGTALTGGQGGILGTFLGTVLMSMISSGLVLAGAPVYWYRVFVGGILVVAVLLNRRFVA